MSIMFKWRCPFCYADNEDDPGETTLPMCWVCGMDFDWNEINEQVADESKQAQAQKEANT